MEDCEKEQIKVSYLKTRLKVVHPLFIELRKFKEEKAICFVVVISCKLVAPLCLFYFDYVATSSLQFAHLFMLLLAPNAFLRSNVEGEITSSQ